MYSDQFVSLIAQSLMMETETVSERSGFYSVPVWPNKNSGSAGLKAMSTLEHICIPIYMHIAKPF
jgi:hypothetical protein